jgi:uncharacterized protein (UPF0303 family)
MERVTIMMTDRDYDLESLSADEDDARLRAFGYDEAWRLGLWSIERMREDSLTGAVTIYLGDQRVFHAALPGTSADLDLWLDRKVRVVRAYSRSSFYMKRLFLAQGRDFASDSLYDAREVMAAGGGMPIRIGEAPVGAIAFSGWHEQGEHALAVEALRTLAAAQGGAADT